MRRASGRRSSGRSGRARRRRIRRTARVTLPAAMQAHYAVSAGSLLLECDFQPGVILLQPAWRRRGRAGVAGEGQLELLDRLAGRGGWWARRAPAGSPRGPGAGEQRARALAGREGGRGRSRRVRAEAELREQRARRLARQLRPRGERRRAASRRWRRPAIPCRRTPIRVGRLRRGGGPWPAVARRAASRSTGRLARCRCGP